MKGSGECLFIDEGVGYLFWFGSVKGRVGVEISGLVRCLVLEEGGWLGLEMSRVEEIGVN